ncbi:unnamed protein product, partial [Discosporangium mesarthrocarpum]
PRFCRRRQEQGLGAICRGHKGSDVGHAGGQAGGPASLSEHPVAPEPRPLGLHASATGLLMRCECSSVVLSERGIPPAKGAPCMAMPGSMVKERVSYCSACGFFFLARNIT